MSATIGGGQFQGLRTHQKKSKYFNPPERIKPELGANNRKLETRDFRAFKINK